MMLRRTFLRTLVGGGAAIVGWEIGSRIAQSDHFIANAINQGIYELGYYRRTSSERNILILEET